MQCIDSRQIDEISMGPTATTRRAVLIESGDNNGSSGSVLSVKVISVNGECVPETL